MTAAGFSSADFGLWQPFSQFLLLALMFAGGCTGSTAGGLKTARVVLAVRLVQLKFRQMVDLRQVAVIRFNGRHVEQAAIRGFNVIVLALVSNFVASLLLAATGLDLVTAISAVTSTMFNVGPGLAAVGPAANYGHLSVFAKWILILAMLAGWTRGDGFHLGRHCRSSLSSSQEHLSCEVPHTGGCNN